MTLDHGFDEGEPETGSGDVESTATLSGTNITINPDTIGSIEIGGEYNTLTTKSADSVSITGDYNIANWDEGAASATDTGTGNTVVAP